VAGECPRGVAVNQQTQQRGRMVGIAASSSLGTFQFG
jgi:hypothetical protein